MINVMILLAAVPLHWTVETSRVQPVVFDAVRGETLALQADFNAYAKPLDLGGEFALFYQTNGMGGAWWQIPATVASNRVTAVFAPTNDPGASAVSCFLGSTGSIYRAAFTLRFRHGPGATPNALAAPVPILDLANTTVVNPPWPTTNDFQTATNNMQAALKDYVDSEIAGASVVTPTTVTNIVDGKIAAIPKDGVSTNAVQGIIDENVRTNYLCTVAAADAAYLGKNDTAANARLAGGIDPRTFALSSALARYLPITGGTITSDLSVGGNLSVSGSILKGGSVIQSNTDGLVILTELDQWVTIGNYGHYSAVHPDGSDFATSNMVNNIINDLAYTKAEASAAFAPTSTAVTVSTLATQVATIGNHLNAEDARCNITNYNSATHLPEMTIEVKQTSGTSNVWLKVWNEMTRWNKFAGGDFDWTAWGGFHPWKTNIESVVENCSPREYAFYDGVTGEVAPDGYFWIGQPRIAVCAGMAYQRYVVGSSCVWVLESNGMVADVNGTTNGYFRITDTEGNTQFEIIKGDKTTLAAKANAMTHQDVVGVTHYYTTYAVTNAVTTPTAYFGTSLTNTFYAAGTASCPANASWTAGVNSYTLEWWPKSSQPQMFVYATYERGGETYINNTAPVKMQTIMIGNKKYSISAVTVSGQTVLGLTEVD